MKKNEKPERKRKRKSVVDDENVGEASQKKRDYSKRKTDKTLKGPKKDNSWRRRFEATPQEKPKKAPPPPKGASILLTKTRESQAKKSAPSKGSQSRKKKCPELQDTYDMEQQQKNIELIGVGASEEHCSSEFFFVNLTRFFFGIFVRHSHLVRYEISY